MLLKRPLELDAPRRSGTIELEHRQAHGEDDERRDQREDALPELLGLGPQVGSLREPDGDEGCSDGQRQEEPERRAQRNLIEESDIRQKKVRATTCLDAQFAHELARGALSVRFVRQRGHHRAVPFPFLAFLFMLRARQGVVGATPVLDEEPMVVSLRQRPGDLLDEAEERRDDDGGLERLSEDWREVGLEAAGWRN
jgi:hypothetical protein